MNGWAGRVMEVLHLVTQVVVLNLLVVLGTLAGVVLGAAPAASSAGALLADLAAGHPPDRLWTPFWRGWRAGLRRANVLAAPFWGAGLFLLLDALVLAAAPGTAPRPLTLALVAVGLYLTAALAFLCPVARRYDVAPARAWRFLLTVPLIAPAGALGALGTVAVCAVLYLELPVLVPLVGVTLPLLNTGWFADRALDRLDARTGA